MRSRLVLISLASLAVGIAAAGCGVVGDGKVSRVDPPFGLSDTAVSTTLAPTSTTDLATTTSGIQVSTTQVPTELVRLYFITDERVKFVATPLPADPSLNQIIAALQAGPPENDLGVGLRSAIPRNITIAASDNNGGVAIVQLPANFFAQMPVPDQRLATAQIVLTVTDSRGIGQVEFNQPVPKPSGALVQPGQALSRNDFATMLEGAPQTTTTTLPATTTTPK